MSRSGPERSRTRAAYDDIADWYVNAFGGRPGTTQPDAIGIHRALDSLLGRGPGTCLDVECGTGAHAAHLRGLGWTPVGVDLSMGMLGYARGHLPLAQGDAARLPFRTASVTAASSIMVHTDMPGYLDVLAEIHRVLAPGGALVHLGVHPCFCGGFADRSDPAAVVVRPGYLEAHWTKASYTDRGIRARLGSNHWPLPDLLGMFIDVGFSLEAFAEGGAPAPIMLAIKARKRRQADVPAPPP